MEKLKLLSPAGSLEALQAAINNGADAVYLGVKNFNARRKNKGNLTFETLPGAIQLAHFHGVEVYVTLNTLIKNQELDLWFKALDQIYQAGADAVIVQDLYLLPFIKERYPDLKIHISTQASIMNAAALKQWQDFADLCVVSRELDFNELRYITEHTKIPVEIFAHGHLCISYSGQCLISSLIGKRSGNRGLCASSCRKEYNDEGYLLSPKDLALLNQIPKIAQTGVHTLKLEGRMKSPEYVGLITKYYRKAIDNYYEGNWVDFTKEDFDQIRMGFNRDFTTGFFMGGEYKKVLSTTLPTHRGIPLGKIQDGKLKIEHDLSINDGIGFWDNRKKQMNGEFLQQLFVKEKSVEKAEKGTEVLIKHKLFKDGTLVYLTSLSKGTPLVGQTKKKELKLEITRASLGKKLELRGNIGGVEITLSTDIELQEAKTSSLLKEQIEDKLNQNNLFHITVQGDIPEKLFLPSSELTKIKERLNTDFLPEVTRESQGPLKTQDLLKKRRTETKKQLVVRADSLELVEILAKDANILYYDLFSSDFRKAKELAKKLNPNIKVFAFTHMALGDTDIEKIKLLLEKERPEGIMLANQGLLEIEKELPFNLEKHAFYTLNAFNDLDLQYLQEKKITPIISVELTQAECRQFKNKDFFYFVHGRPVVMNFKGEREEEKLTDEKKITFPLLITPNNNTEMLYSRKIALLDKTKQLLQDKMEQFYLEFLHKDYWKNPQKAKEELQVYNNVLEGKAVGDISLLKHKTTIGNFTKGVL